jgi:hypothetical protein
LTHVPQYALSREIIQFRVVAEDVHALFDITLLRIIGFYFKRQCDMLQFFPRANDHDVVIGQIIMAFNAMLAYGRISYISVDHSPSPQVLMHLDRLVNYVDAV